jgi:hypothetical protein
MITMLFQGRKQPLFNMFGKKRKNRGMMWASLLGLGVSAAAYGLRRNRNMNSMQQLQSIMNNFRMNKPAQMPKMAGLTEFSKEILPNKNPSQNK